jgi:hypothetical protein
MRFFTRTRSFIFSAVTSVATARRLSPGVAQRNIEAGASRARSEMSKIDNDLLGRPLNR